MNQGKLMYKHWTSFWKKINMEKQEENLPYWTDSDTATKLDKILYPVSSPYFCDIQVSILITKYQISKYQREVLLVFPN